MMMTIAIISILSAVVLASMSGVRERSRDEERITELGQIALAVEMYYNSCREYPSALAAGTNNGCPAGVTFGSFMATIPTDPQNAGTQVYTYETGGGNTQYVVHVELETAHQALANDIDVNPVTGSTIDCTDGDPNFCHSSQ